MTEEPRQIQLTNQIKFDSRSFRSIEHECVHSFHSMLHTIQLYVSITLIWMIKYVQYLIITWIITSHLESLYRHNELSATHDEVD